jgi:hypothetical protein
VAEVAGTDKFARANAGAVELGEQSERRSFVDCVPQGVDANTGFAQLTVSPEHGAVDAGGVQRQCRRFVRPPAA